MIDDFIAAMIRIAGEAESEPELLLEAPHSTPIRRTDDVLAARRPVLNYDDELNLPQGE